MRITEDVYEWKKPINGVSQNKHCKSVFHNIVTGVYYDTESALLSEDGGETFHPDERVWQIIELPYVVPQRKMRFVVLDNQCFPNELALYIDKKDSPLFVNPDVEIVMLWDESSNILF